jgi:hypothetical protein
VYYEEWFQSLFIPSYPVDIPCKQTDLYILGGPSTLIPPLLIGLPRRHLLLSWPNKNEL